MIWATLYLGIGLGRNLTLVIEDGARPGPVEFFLGLWLWPIGLWKFRGRT